MFFKFLPLLKQTIWGGDKIPLLKGLDYGLAKVGESWEISGLPGKETVVASGDYVGLTPNELVAAMGEQLLGKANYARFGNEFPLLVKLIDANQDLSIQVHPDDATAERVGRGKGKTEMWYALPSDPGSYLYNGLRQPLTPKKYKEMVANDTICDALARHDVIEGDVFYIPAGRIHSIGKGCFVVEIQQTSDVTFRIYDYKRCDSEGNYRELHTKEAAESIDYMVHDDYQINYEPEKGEYVYLVENPFFSTSLIDVKDDFIIDYEGYDSFIILTCVKGCCTVYDDERNYTSLRFGETILLPATTRGITIEGNCRLLETSIDERRDYST